MHASPHPLHAANFLRSSVEGGAALMFEFDLEYENSSNQLQSWSRDWNPLDVLQLLLRNCCMDLWIDFLSDELAPQLKHCILSSPKFSDYLDLKAAANWAYALPSMCSGDTKRYLIMAVDADIELLWAQLY